MGIKEIRANRGQRRVKPQEHWGWPIAIYLYLAGMGAGSFIVGMIINWFLDPSKLIQLPVFYVSFDLAKAAILWGAPVVAIGSPFLILDLGIKRRFMYACVNPKTSWVARGFLILSTFILFGLATLVISALPHFGLRQEKGLLMTLEIISFVFAIGTAIYTGILLKSVKYIPIWNTPLLEVLFLSSALTTGLMGIILSAKGYSLLISSEDSLGFLVHKLIRVDQVLILIEGFLLTLYFFSRSRTKDQSKDSVHLLISGDMKVLFWGGIVLTGFVFPLVLLSLNSYFPTYSIFLFVSGFLLLIGRFFLRLGVLASGIKEQIPMHKLIEIQANMQPLRSV